MSNLCFINVALSRRFCFCSAVKQWGSHRAQNCLFCKCFAKIRNTDVGEIPAACDISLHVSRLSCVKQSSTSFTLLSSVDVFGIPGLWSSFMVTHPLRKREAKRETVLQPTVCSSKTSRKALWISVWFLLRKVSVLMHDLWSSTVTVPRPLQTPCLTLVYSKRCTLGK